jgi:hypothetical protein
MIGIRKVLERFSGNGSHTLALSADTRNHMAFKVVVPTTVRKALNTSHAINNKFDFDPHSPFDASIAFSAAMQVLKISNHDIILDDHLLRELHETAVVRILIVVIRTVDPTTGIFMEH